MKKLKTAMLITLIFIGLQCFTIDSGQPRVTFEKIFKDINNEETFKWLSEFSAEQKRIVELCVFINVVQPIYELANQKSITKAGLTESYLGFNLEHWISENYEGEIIKLEDGSIWHVADFDRIISVLWLPIDDVEIYKLKEPIENYQYVMVKKSEFYEDEIVCVELLKQ
jgi:hypothetical protein